LCTLIFCRKFFESFEDSKDWEGNDWRFLKMWLKFCF